MDPETNQLEESPHVMLLRSQVRDAILRKRKADARGILGKLVAMSGDRADRENLEELIRGVGMEVDRYVRECGSIQKRLQDGATLEAVQQELNSRMPYWRAFANDLPELQVVRDGLPANEDPRLKERLKVLERKLAAGEVDVVITEWEEMGEPEAAASGALVQVLNSVACLRDKFDSRKWSDAKAVLEEAKNLLESDEGAAFQPGLGTYLKSAEDRLRWELLLKKSASSQNLMGRERQSLLVELSRAESDVDFQLRDTPSLNEIHERIKAAIEDMEAIREEAPTNDGFVRSLVVTILIIVLALIAAWLYFRSSSSSGPSSWNPSNMLIPNQIDIASRAGWPQNAS